MLSRWWYWKFYGFKVSWLRANFEILSNYAIEMEKIQIAWAYILQLIGVLMSDSNNNIVHLMYLPLLSSLQGARSYNWGSTVLATLYRELCWATKHRTIDIGGCLILLQSWTLYRMPFLASVGHQVHVFSLVSR